MNRTEDDPPHPILPKAYAWELTEFVYRREADHRESYINMRFEADGTVRRLRFYDPRDLKITRGLPHAGGMLILDVSGRQLDGIGVRVISFEEDFGVPTFWAARVVDLDCTDPDPG